MEEADVERIALVAARRLHGCDVWREYVGGPLLLAFGGITCRIPISFSRPPPLTEERIDQSVCAAADRIMDKLWLMSHTSWSDFFDAMERGEEEGISGWRLCTFAEESVRLVRDRKKSP